MNNLFSPALSNTPINSRLLLPETIWLEPEQMAQAKAMSDRTAPEAQQWQIYLNALALLSFEQWLRDHLPAASLVRSMQSCESRYLEVNGFTCCLITIEHMLDETVRIPQAIVEQPELAAHFYVLQEVSEEQELVTIRGFLRFDELINYRDRRNCQLQNGYYELPYSLLDTEPNHLLFYCRTLAPTAIALPSRSSSPTENLFGALTQTTTKLTQWLQDAFDESWQTIEQLINAEVQLALSTRSIASGVRRGKLINLGVQLGPQTVALLVNVTTEENEKLGVLVQLHPTGISRYLTPDLKLSLRSPTGKILQMVTARSQDNYIQLKPFKGEAGTCFSVAVDRGGETVTENFEL
jgi:Protein of unknown function (DUF1822)